MEIELITSLPLGRGSSDELIWPHVSLGIYSVKSGYNFLLKEKVSASLDNFRPPQLQGLWKQIWTSKVPNKVRNFLWRGCKNALPVKTNLVRRNVLAEGVCDHCKQLPEDTSCRLVLPRNSCSMGFSLNLEFFPLNRFLQLH